MFITSKNAIVESIEKGLTKIIYIKEPISKREKDIVKLANKKNVIIKNIDKKEMEKIVGKIYSIVADVEENSSLDLNYFLDSTISQKINPLIFILDSITDVHNVGAIIRNAYFFDVSGIIIPRDNSAPINEKVYEISSGAAYHLPIIKETNLSRTIENIKEKGFWIYYTAENGNISIENFKFNSPTAIILGNEHSGVRDILKKHSDDSIAIKAKNKFDSLNVSATSAIIAYTYSIYKI